MPTKYTLIILATLYVISYRTTANFVTVILEDLRRPATSDPPAVPDPPALAGVACYDVYNDNDNSNDDNNDNNRTTSGDNNNNKCSNKAKLSVTFLNNLLFLTPYS